ncbi:hypothetical protein SAY87_025817 [Trapa incisa]|uniref:Uncharacterized protein n=1 Tax=Trapa incisa TaxID=236973 RepID=A0AAN7GIJ4_9MYRT|nr:hypothetical protein SAY87_025817 [Trapa incisa]
MQLWLPIARRTVEWIATRESPRQRPSHYKVEAHNINTGQAQGSSPPPPQASKALQGCNAYSNSMRLTVPIHYKGACFSMVYGHWSITIAATHVIYVYDHKYLHLQTDGDQNTNQK